MMAKAADRLACRKVKGLLLARCGPVAEREGYGNVRLAAVVTEGLHIQHIQAHHRDLLEPQHVRDIADAVTRLIGE